MTFKELDRRISEKPAVFIDADLFGLTKSAAGFIPAARKLIIAIIIIVVVTKLSTLLSDRLGHFLAKL